MGNGDVWTLLCVRPGQLPAPYSTWHGSLFGPTRCWGHGLASSESRHEPNCCLGSNVSLDPRHVCPLPPTPPHVPPIGSVLLQWAILIFSFGAKCELGGYALLAWLHTLATYCHQFNDTICICAAFSHINLLPTNVETVPWIRFIQGVSDYFKIVPKFEPMQPACGWFLNVGR